MKEVFNELDLEEFKEFIHFGLTSQDINNTAIPLSIKDAIEENYLRHLKKILKDLEDKAKEWKEVPMLARTHGQAASPTRLGKEIMVFVERIKNQLTLLKSVPFSGKFGGATGNFNAHHIAYPEIDWVSFSNKFISSAYFRISI